MFGCIPGALPSLGTEPPPEFSTRSSQLSLATRFDGANAMLAGYISLDFRA